LEREIKGTHRNVKAIDKKNSPNRIGTNKERRNLKNGLPIAKPQKKEEKMEDGPPLRARGRP
jgi:hypothetical protein